MATPSAGWDNKFSTSLSSGITASDTTIPLTNLPTASEGWLVIEPDSSTAWEEIYYTSKTGSAVVCPSVGAGRGQGGSTAASHTTGATVRCDTTAEMFEALQDHSAMGVGLVTQVVSSNSTAYATGTAQIPLDDTIPQNIEGTQFMTASITPKSTTNKLVIEVLAFHSSDGAVVDIIGALFQDSIANALSAVSIVQAGTTYKELLLLRYVMTAGTTSSITFKYRAGPASAVNLYFNGSGARLFGGVAGSNMTVTEYKA